MIVWNLRPVMPYPIDRGSLAGQRSIECEVPRVRTCS